MSNRKHVTVDEAWFAVACPACPLAQKNPLASWQSGVQNNGGILHAADSRPRATILSLLRKLQMSLLLLGVLAAVSGYLV
jgi:hypothetical protein